MIAVRHRTGPPRGNRASPPRRSGADFLIPPSVQSLFSEQFLHRSPIFLCFLYRKKRPTTTEKSRRRNRPLDPFRTMEHGSVVSSADPRRAPAFSRLHCGPCSRRRVGSLRHSTAIQRRASCQLAIPRTGESDRPRSEVAGDRRNGVIRLISREIKLRACTPRTSPSSDGCQAAQQNGDGTDAR